MANLRFSRLTNWVIAQENKINKKTEQLIKEQAEEALRLYRIFLSNARTEFAYLNIPEDYNDKLYHRFYNKIASFGPEHVFDGGRNALVWETFTVVFAAVFTVPFSVFIQPLGLPIGCLIGISSIYVAITVLFGYGASKLLQICRLRALAKYVAMLEIFCKRKGESIETLFPGVTAIKIF